MRTIDTTLAHEDPGKVATSLGDAYANGKRLDPKKKPAGAPPAPPRFGGRFKPPQTTMFTAMAVKASVAENLEDIRTYVEEHWVGAFNDDPRYYTDAIHEGSHGIVKFIGEFGNAKGRQELSVGVINMLLDLLPPTGPAVNTVGDLGVALKVFTTISREEAKKLDKHQIAYIPLTGDDGEWHATPVTCYFPGSRGVLAKLTTLNDKAKAVADEQERAEKRALYNDTAGSLLTVLEQGFGYAAFHSPDAGEHKGGTVRISVTNGMVDAVEAVGGCAGLIRKVFDSGMGIPLDQIETDGPLRFKDRIPEETKRLLAGFRYVLRRGIAFARKKAEEGETINGLGEQATLTPEEFYLAGKQGTCLLKIRPGFRVKVPVPVTGGETGKRVMEERTMRSPVAILWERSDAGIRIKDHAPKGTAWDELLASAKEFALEGEHYGGIKGLPCHLLRVFHSATERRATPTQKPAEVATAPVVMTEEDFTKKPDGSSTAPDQQ